MLKVKNLVDTSGLLINSLPKKNSPAANISGSNRENKMDPGERISCLS
jgi:hypothetical protein